MKSGGNIIQPLRKVQLHGVAPSLEVFTIWDNCKDVQAPPELHISFEGEPVTILKIRRSSDDLDDERESGPEAGPCTVSERAKKSCEMNRKRVKRSGKEPAKYSPSFYEKTGSKRVEGEDAESAPQMRMKEQIAGQSARETGAPTVHFALRHAKQTVELQKAKILSLEEAVASLKDERNYLRERLEDALKQKQDGLIQHQQSAAVSQAPPVHHMAARNHSPTSTDSSESSDSEDSEPLTRRKRAKKKKSKKPKTDFTQVRTPEDAIKRYNMVLELVQGGCSKMAAYNRMNVDRNTIVNQAPVAELAAVNPELFRTLRVNFGKGTNLQKFAKLCEDQCSLQPNQTLITAMKEKGNLLDITKK